MEVDWKQDELLKLLQIDRDIEVAGCYTDCYDFHVLTLDMSAGYRWNAELKEIKFIYVCIHT